MISIAETLNANIFLFSQIVFVESAQIYLFLNLNILSYNGFMRHSFYTSTQVDFGLIGTWAILF